MQCLYLFSRQNEASFVIENRLSSGMSYGFAVMDGSNLYKTERCLMKHGQEL